MQEFEKLYLSGLSVPKICTMLHIPCRRGYEIKRQCNIKTFPRWMRSGLPTKFSQTTREILIGSLLGDGWVGKTGNNIFCKFSLSHSPKQIEYLTWMRNNLTELKPSSISSAKDQWNTLRFYTPPHPEFEELRKLCYDKDDKQVSEEWLEQLTPLGMAIWYMDDGGTQNKAYGCKIATCSFNENSCGEICKYLKNKWNIQTFIRQYKSDKNYPRLCFNSENSKKLKNVIEPYVIPSMRYKFNWN